MSIRRAVWQMKHAGWFSHVKGFLIGRPAVFGQEMMGLDQYHAVTDLLAGYQVPVSYGCGYRTYPTDDAACLRKHGRGLREGE